MTSSFRTPESEATRKAPCPTGSHHSAIWWLLRVVSEAEKKLHKYITFGPKGTRRFFKKSHIEISQIIPPKKKRQRDSATSVAILTNKTSPSPCSACEDAFMCSGCSYLCYRHLNGVTQCGCNARGGLAGILAKRLFHFHCCR